MSTISRRSALAAIAATPLLGVACGNDGAGGSDAVTLRYAMNSPEANPIYGAAEHLAESLEEGTAGRYAIEIFPNETLGTEQETLGLIEDGSLDLAIVSSPVLSSLNPDFVVFDLPFIFDSIEHQMTIINNPDVVQELYTSLEERGIAVLGAFTQGERNVYTTEGPVQVPEDLNGLKLRVQESELFTSMLQAMGASPTPLSFGEVYTALQSGVVDGAENNEVSYAASKHFEVAQHYSYTRHIIAVDYLVASTQTLDTMDSEDREALTSSFHSAVDMHVSLWDEETKNSIAQAEEGGATFHDNVDADAFRTALQPVVDSYTSESESIAAIVDRARGEST